MSKKQERALELRLCRAMDRAIRKGWYPARTGILHHTDEAKGCCCVFGALDIASAPFIYLLPIGIGHGFEGERFNPRDYHDPAAYRIGQRLAARYLVLP